MISKISLCEHTRRHMVCEVSVSPGQIRRIAMMVRRKSEYKEVVEDTVYEADFFGLKYTVDLGRPNNHRFPLRIKLDQDEIGVSFALGRDKKDVYLASEHPKLARILEKIAENLIIEIAALEQPIVKEEQYTFSEKVSSIWLFFKMMIYPIQIFVAIMYIRNFPVDPTYAQILIRELLTLLAFVNIGHYGWLILKSKMEKNQ